MSRLFELSREFAEICDRMNEIAEDDALTPAEQEQLIGELLLELDRVDSGMKEKVLNIAGYVKELEAEADALKLYEKRTKQRRNGKENLAKRLKQYTQNCLEIANVTKVESVESVVTLRRNPPAVKIKDESAMILELEGLNFDDALEYSEPKIKKSIVKDYLKGGYEFVNAELTSSTSVIIK